MWIIGKLLMKINSKVYPGKTTADEQEQNIRREAELDRLRWEQRQNLLRSECGKDAEEFVDRRKGNSRRNRDMYANRAEMDLKAVRVLGIPVPWILIFNLAAVIVFAVSSFSGLRYDFKAYQLIEEARISNVEKQQDLMQKQLDKLTALAESQYELQRDMFRYFRSSDPKFKKEFSDSELPKK